MTEQVRQYEAILPCGGKGSRLAVLSGDIVPKSLFNVGGKELIRYTTDTLEPTIVPKLVFAIAHHAEMMRSWIAKAELPYELDFSEQTQPGVLGAIAAGMDRIPSRGVIACNTDEIRLGLHLRDAVAFHESHRGFATMVITRSAGLSRHRLINLDRHNRRIVETSLKPIEYRNHPQETGLVNTGFFIMEHEVTNYFDPAHSKDWSGLIDPLCDAGQLYGYVNEGIRYFNVGTPDEYSEAEMYLKNNA